MQPKSSIPGRAAIGAVALMLLAGPAAAQLGRNAKGPVDVTADGGSFDNSTCTATWRGNVEALQGDARLRADTLVTYQDKKAANPGGSPTCGETTRVEAHGAVYYATPDERVHGDDAVYIAGSNMLTVTGDVVMVQGQNVLRGTHLVVNTQTGEAHLQGAASGRNKPNRVRGVFYPQQRRQQQQQQQQRRGSGPIPAGAPQR